MATAVEDKVKKIIVEQLGVDEGEVTSSASFVDDLGADSLDTVELVMAFEESFDIEIPDEDAEKIRTVKDAVEYIENDLAIAALRSEARGNLFVYMEGRRFAFDLATVSGSGDEIILVRDFVEKPVRWKDGKGSIKR